MALTTALQKVEALYVAYYGRAGDPSGVTYWVNQLNSGKSFSDLAGYFAVQTESKVAYPYLANPGLVDPTTFVQQIYQNLFARAPDAAGLNYWVAQLTANQGNVAFVAQFINYVIGGAAPADVTVLDNKVAAGTYFTQYVATQGYDIVGPDGQLTPAGAAAAKAATGPLVTGDPASVTASEAATNTFNPTTPFHLTTATDNIVGTSGGDTIYAGALAPNGVTAATTLNVLDTINGGGGIDTLVVDTTGGVNATIQGTITNVENVTIVGSGNINTFDAGIFPRNITFQQTTDTSVGLTNVTGQTLTLDRVADSTVLTAGYAATQATATLKASGLVGSAQFNISGAALKTASLTLDKTDVANAKEARVSDGSGVLETVNLAVAGASIVRVDSTALKSVNITGAGAVSLAVGTLAKDSVDASGNTGGVTLVNQFADTASFTGGSGKDSLTIGANTKAIALGAGDDTLTWQGAVLGTGGTADGGEGVDTLVLTAASAETATSTALLGKAFADSISNFEKLSISATTAATVIDAQYLDGINHIISAGTVGAFNLAVNNLAANATFETTGALAAAVALNLKDATGASDVVNLKFSATDGFASAGAITVAGVETLNIVTSDSDTTTAATNPFQVALAATSVKTVVVSGDIGVNFTNTLSATTLTSLDASGLTGTGSAGGVTYTSGALAGVAIVKGGAGNDFLNLSASTKSATIDGGGGNDQITGTAFADTINGGAGNDTIDSGFGLDIITGGAGADILKVNVNTNGNIYATITDAAAGDKLQFTGKGTDTFADVKVTLADTAVFQDYLNEAAKTVVAGDGVLSWFQWSGNTYVVDDVSASTSFVNGADSVVKLSGLIDLSTSTTATNALTLA